MMQYLGNKEILKEYKTAFLCSRKCPANIVLESLDWAREQKEKGNCIISGSHSQIEKDVFDILIKGKQPLILVLARGMKKRWPDKIKKAVKENRLLVISPFNETVKYITSETAKERNEIMVNMSDEIFIAFRSLGNNLDRLIETLNGKNVRTF